MTPRLDAIPPTANGCAPSAEVRLTRGRGRPPSPTTLAAQCRALLASLDAEVARLRAPVARSGDPALDAMRAAVRERETERRGRERERVEEWLRVTGGGA